MYNVLPSINTYTLGLGITNFKSIDNRLKSAEVIRPIKSINAGNSSHLMIKKASCHLHIVHYLLTHTSKVCLLE